MVFWHWLNVHAHARDQLLRIFHIFFTFFLFPFLLFIYLSVVLLTAFHRHQENCSYFIFHMSNNEFDAVFDRLIDQTLYRVCKSNAIKIKKNDENIYSVILFVECTVCETANRYYVFEWKWYLINKSVWIYYARRAQSAILSFHSLCSLLLLHISAVSIQSVPTPNRSIVNRTFVRSTIYQQFGILRDKTFLCARVCVCVDTLLLIRTDAAASRPPQMLFTCRCAWCYFFHSFS